MSRRGAIVIGVAAFAAGGAILAFAGPSGAAAGTICGLAGLGLVGWSLLRARP